MEYVDRLRTAAMGTLLATFADHQMYGDHGGVVQMTPDQLQIEQERKETNAEGGSDEWIYTTTIDVMVRRRRVH